ncbi:MAG: hypothetical protein U0610_04310 [bacterium]
MSPPTGASCRTLRGFGDLTVLDDVRYVRDGNVVTAAGVSAGIDMALGWSRAVGDCARAHHAARAIQYDPAPPYAAEGVSGARSRPPDQEAWARSE